MDVVAPEDIQVAAQTLVVSAGRVAPATAKKERTQGAELDLAALGPLLDVELEKVVEESLSARPSEAERSGVAGPLPGDRLAVLAFDSIPVVQGSCASPGHATGVELEEREFGQVEVIMPLAFLFRGISSPSWIRLQVGNLGRPRVLSR